MVELSVIFKLETGLTSTNKIEISTNRARVIFYPSESESHIIAKAEVITEGPTEVGAVTIARHELIKVLLRHLGPKSKILDHFEEIRLLNNPKPGVDTVRKEITSAAYIIGPQNSSSPHNLKIDVNGDIVAILQYYEALIREHPVDKYRELFKIIEYFSEVRSSGGSGRKQIRDGLDKKWFIPEGGLKKDIKNINLYRDGKLLRNPSDILCELRDRSSHLKVRYGTRPNDERDRKKVEKALPYLEKIVKYSLETNKKTRENV